MLELSDRGLLRRAEWEEKGYDLPKFDREAMKRETRLHPQWIHFGAGNIFRAFQCRAVQKLLDAGKMKTGLIAAEGYDYEIVGKGLRPMDTLSIAVTLKADGKVEKTVVASIANAAVLDSENEEEFRYLKEVFSNPSLQIASFTITEKGYSLKNGAGETPPDIASDMQAGPARPQSYLGKVSALLFARYQAGAAPIAMVSMDNCSHNGEKLKTAVTAFARAWKDPGFLSYVEDEKRVSFPWTMIDKITPRPDPSVEAMLRADGLNGLDPVITSKHTYIAPFVNAEESEYLVIEDAFPNGRPPLEEAGFIFTDRDTVNRVERMKVTTCLNPLHTALAIFGCLLGYTRISDEMRDADLVRLIRQIGYTEGLPVVTDPGVIDPKAFIDTVVNVRLPNPFMPDTPQRIACDTSQKLPIRFGETIKGYMASPQLDPAMLKGIPLVLAGWLRYLMGIDDNGSPMQLSPDPRLTEMQDAVRPLTLGKTDNVAETVLPILADDTLFGVPLTKCGLAESVIANLEKMLVSPGAVRRALHDF